LRRLELVNEAGRTMSAILDIDQLLERILSLMDEVFHFADCAVLLLDPVANELFILKSRGYDPDVVRTFRAGPGQGITGTVLVQGKPISVEDVLTDPRYIRGVPGAHSEIAAPLIVDEMIIGVLDAETSVPRRMSQEDLDFFTLFATQAASAIHNARMHYQVALHARILEQRLEQMGGLLASCRMLTDGSNRSEVTHAILEALLEASASDSCSLLLLEDDGETLFEHLKLGPALFRHPAFKPDESAGALGSVLRHREAVAIPNLASEPEPYEGFPGHGTELVAPLLDMGKPTGAVVGHRSIGDAPSEMDLALFEGFTTLLALNLARPGKS
jgi:GAF domain-containing protein